MSELCHRILIQPWDTANFHYLSFLSLNKPNTQANMYWARVSNDSLVSLTTGCLSSLSLLHLWSPHFCVTSPRSLPASQPKTHMLPSLSLWGLIIRAYFSWVPLARLGVSLAVAPLTRSQVAVADCNRHWNILLGSFAHTHTCTLVCTLAQLHSYAYIPKTQIKFTLRATGFKPYWYI